MLATGVMCQSIEPKLTADLRAYISEKQNDLNDKVKFNILVKRVTDGALVYQLNESEVIPMASVQKLLITYATLKILGPDYRIPTEVYITRPNGSGQRRFDSGIAEGRNLNELPLELPNLFLRPYGDPSFQYGDFLTIVHEIKTRGINIVNDVAVDRSVFGDPEEVKGSESFNAAQTAAAIEFNTYNLKVYPSVTVGPAKITLSPGLYGEITNRVKTLSTKGINISANQTPDTAIWIGKGFQPAGVWKPTKFKIFADGKIGLTDEAFSLYKSHPEPDSNYMASLKSALEQFGIVIKGEFRFATVPANAELLFEHPSARLAEILTQLNHFSNNFIANQLLYSIGQNKTGVLTKAEGLKRLNETLNAIPNYPDAGILVDASGLSIANRISPEQIVAVLIHVYSDLGIFPGFVAALPRFGLSGTLAERDLLGEEAKSPILTSFYQDLLRRTKSIWAKPGYVDGVHSIAGFVESERLQRLSFSITLRGELEKKSASSIQDDILKIILGIKKSSK